MAMRCADVAAICKEETATTAIFFVFSRRGCEEEAGHVRRSLQLLSRRRTEARKIIRHGRWTTRPSRRWIRRMTAYNYSREVSRRTAGLLPQYKTLVEDLFKKRTGESLLRY